MSFCNDVKSEIISEKISKCCARAEAHGLACAVRRGAHGKVQLQTEQADVAQLAVKRFEKFFSAECSVKVSESGQLYTVRILSGDVSAEPQSEMDDCCRCSFIKGAFLSCGPMIDPNKKYRLDFLFPNAENAETVAEALEKSGFAPKKSSRKDLKQVLYFNDSSSIEDLLTYMGATSSTLALMEVKVEKDYKNTVNRRGNFDTANYVKSYMKFTAQLTAIDQIKRSGMFTSLPDDLKAAAELRLTNPEATLNELAAVSGVSRSTLNRRLNKLIAFSKKIKQGG